MTGSKKKYTDSELISKAITWFQIIEEETRQVNAANLSHNLPCIRGRALRSREFLEKHRMKLDKHIDSTYSHDEDIETLKNKGVI